MTKAALGRLFAFGISWKVFFTTETQRHRGPRLVRSSRLN